jgi:hypothetical protein
MTLPLLVGAALVVLTVLMHGYGSMALLRMLLAHHVGEDGKLLPSRAQLAVILTALGLLLLHWFQILLWAVAYRLLTPVEPIGTLNGVLLLGWSTALLYAVVHRFWEHAYQVRKG